MKTKVKLLKMNMPELAKTLGQKSLPTLDKKDLAGQSIRVDEVDDNGKINVRRIVTLSNEYINHYWLIHSYSKNTYILVCHGDKPMFVMGELSKTIQDIVGPFTWDNDENNPVNLNYYSPFKLENQKYILKDSTVLPINWLSRIEYEGLDSAQQKLVKDLVGEERSELSPILHTNKTLKYIKTGRQPETYFHETSGQYFPRHQSEEVSKKYKYHVNITATETWCTSPHADVQTMDAPEPEVIIYEKSWNQLTNSYMKGKEVAKVQLTQFVQQNLVDSVQNNDLKIFDVKNIRVLTAETGEILFPVNYTPVSYAEHNKRHSKGLNELHIWLNENLGETFEENIYESIEQYIKFNRISGIDKIGRATAVTRCLKLKKFGGFEKSYLADIEVKSTAYIALFRAAGDGIELLYAVPYRNHSTYYENYKEDDEGVVKANNKEIRQIKLEKAAYEMYLVQSPRIRKELAFLISKLV